MREYHVKKHYFKHPKIHQKIKNYIIIEIKKIFLSILGLVVTLIIVVIKRKYLINLYIDLIENTLKNFEKNIIFLIIIPFVFIIFNIYVLIVLFNFLNYFYKIIKCYKNKNKKIIKIKIKKKIYQKTVI